MTATVKDLLAAALRSASRQQQAQETAKAVATGINPPRPPLSAAPGAHEPAATGPHAGTTVS